MHVKNVRHSNTCACECKCSITNVAVAQPSAGLACICTMDVNKDAYMCVHHRTQAFLRWFAGYYYNGFRWILIAGPYNASTPDFTAAAAQSWLATPLSAAAAHPSGAGITGSTSTGNLVPQRRLLQFSNLIDHSLSPPNRPVWLL